MHQPLSLLPKETQKLAQKFFAGDDSLEAFIAASAVRGEQWRAVDVDRSFKGRITTPALLSQGRKGFIPGNNSTRQFSSAQAWEARYESLAPCDDDKLRAQAHFMQLVSARLTQLNSTKPTVLEIGAGSLEFSLQLRERFPTLPIIATDIASPSPSRLQEIRKREVQFIAVAGEDLAELKGSVKPSIVIGFAAIEHANIKKTVHALKVLMQGTGELHLFVTASDSPHIASMAFDLRLLEVKLLARRLAYEFLLKASEKAKESLLQDPDAMLAGLQDEFAVDLSDSPVLRDRIRAKKQSAEHQLREFLQRVMVHHELVGSDMFKVLQLLKDQIQKLQMRYDQYLRLSEPLFRLRETALTSRYGVDKLLEIFNQESFVLVDGGWSVTTGTRRYHYLHLNATSNRE